MPGEESLILRRRLAHEFDLTLHSFRYSAAYSNMGAITARLEGFVRELQSSEVHFVGHVRGRPSSIDFFERLREQPPPGRAVFLGTPCVASRAAEEAGRFAPVAHFMGQSVAEELAAAARAGAGRTSGRSGSSPAPNRSGWGSCWRTSTRTTTARSR